MKKLTCWLLMAVMVMGLAGCGGEEATKEPSTPTQTPVSDVAEEPIVPMPERALDVTPTDDVLIIKPEPAPTQSTVEPEPDAAAVEPEPSATQPARIATGKLEWEDQNGYRFVANFALSDWIRANDEKLLNATWEGVNQGVDFPSFSPYLDVGSKFFGKGYGENNPYVCSEVVYAVGYVEINNATKGFDITATNPTTAMFSMYASTPFSVLEFVRDGKVIACYANDAKNTHRVMNIAETGGLFSEKEAANYYGGSGLFIVDGNAGMPSFKMTSNSTGRIPLVLGIGITKGPKYPDGLPDPNKVNVAAYAIDFADSNKPGFGEVKACDFLPQLAQ